MADLYTRVDGDPGFVPNRIEEIDEPLILLNQIEMLLFTRQYDVMGAETMGCNIEDLLWSMTVSAGVIKSTIYNQISYFCPLAQRFRVEVDVRIFKGTERDIGVIDILVNGSLKTGYVIS